MSNGMTATLQAKIEHKVNNLVAEVIEDVLDDARAEFAESLGGIVAALEGPGVVPAKGGGRAPAGDKPKPKPRKPRAAVPKKPKANEAEVAAVAAKVLAFVATHPQSGKAAIAAHLKLESIDLLLPVRHLLETKALTFTGVKRGTKYSAA